MKEKEKERESERIRECSLCMHGCVALFYFFIFWIAADMELAEEDGIVRIRRWDFTKRGLPTCNSFWRPWNCYCEKFSSCNSNTESPQTGWVQPPPPFTTTHNTHTTTTPTFFWSMIAWKPLGVWMLWFGFLWILQLLKIFKPLWGMDDISHSLMPLHVHP